MEALDVLLNRVSSPRPGMTMPSQKVLDNMFLAALRAPDHGQLKPWRFLIVKGDARCALGDLFASAKQQEQPSATEVSLDKARQKPLRAPLIIVVIACLQDHASVPEIEQMMSAGAAAQNMLLAAHAQGAGAMWRTGGMAYSSTVLSGLGLQANERLIGYLYVGSEPGKTRDVPQLDTAEYFSIWPKVE